LSTWRSPYFLLICVARSNVEAVILLQTYKSRTITALFYPFSLVKVNITDWLVLFIRLHLQKNQFLCFGR
jgi:hypothetical protein